MKKLLTIFTVTILTASCSTQSFKTTQRNEKCVVTNVSWEYKYGGLINERVYTITTENGYKISSSKHVEVGDTIDVQVIALSK
jgi:hypothetical protein